MSAVPSASGGGLPTRSEIENWSTADLRDAANAWRLAATQSEDAFAQHRQNIAAPGGTTWVGDAKDAALDRVTADVAVVDRQSGVLREAADLAESGSYDINAAQAKAIDAITTAENDGFRVSENLAVTDTRRYDITTIVERNKAAAEHAEDIRWTAEQLTQADTLVGDRLQAKAAELEGIRFDGESDEPDSPSGHVQLVDNKFKLNPPDQPADDDEDHPQPDAAATSDVGGDLGDLLGVPDPSEDKPGDEKPGEPPAAPGQTPQQSALDEILNQHTGKGDGQEKPYTHSPLTAPIVAADPSVLDRQRARVDAAHESLRAAQAKMDAAAGQGYIQGAGAGPSRDDTNRLSQAVFDARAEVTEQTKILEDLNKAAAETGRPTVPIPPLPENADVQAFPPQPSAFAEGSRALSEGSLGLIPDVAKDAHTFANWDQASTADKTQAILDAAGMAPIPGGKLLGEGLEHALPAVARHLDDIPTPHTHVDTPAGGHAPVDAPVEHHAPAPDVPAEHHAPADTGHVAPYGIDDTSALLTASENAGGHLIERHVGQTFDDLSARLESTRLPVVSSFDTAGEAASAVSTAIQRNQQVIDEWLSNGAVRYLELDAPFNGGAVLERGTAEAVAGTGVRVVLKSDGNGGWYVLTGFPTP